MFEGEKTLLFWAGLIILSLASLVLFSVFWGFLHYAPSVSRINLISNNFPIIVGGIVFILIGLYMMKSGIKKTQPQTVQT